MNLEGRISIKEKLAFGVGDMGCNFVWTTVSSFLTLYYTDNVGLSAGVAGTIMLITRLLDGFTDLGFGTILDHTNTKMGKARPWILWSTPMMVLGLIALFNVPSGLSMNGKIVYSAATYIFLAAIAYTISNLSYNALLSLMTDNQQDRTTASTIRFILTLLTAIAISSITMPLVNRFGWGMTSVIYGAAAAACFMVTFFGTRERHQEHPENGDRNSSNVSIGEGFRTLFKNRYFYSITLIFLMLYLGQGVASGIGIYFARDVIGNENVFGVFSIAQLLPMVIGLFIFPSLTARFGKWNVMMVGCVISIFGTFIMLINPASLSLVIAGLVIKGLGQAPMSAGVFALVGDGVVYGEWKNGLRQDGLFNSVTSFGMKVGTGIGTAMVGWGLEIGQYSNSGIQSPETLTAIKILYIVIPLAASILGLIALAFSNLDRIYPQMEKDLAARHSADMK